MASPGYSGTPLPKKLGIKEGATLCFLHPPRGYFAHLGPLPSSCSKKRKLEPDLDLIQLFSKSEAEVAVLLPELKASIVPNGMIWICWPKRTSGVSTDLGDSVVRRLGLAAGLVDVKVCAIDETWSALKFCIRVKDRPRKA